MINMAKKTTDDISRMPAVPDLFYRSQWKGWDDFLGTMYPYDWEIVEIIKFNYNGLGDAIALCDGRTTYVHLVDLNALLFGSQHGGSHYDTVATEGDRIIMRKSSFARNSPVVAEKPKKKTKRKTKNVRKTKNKK
jgi:hypothetical protein